MIDKKAYDMLVDNYTDEIVKEAMSRRGIGIAVGGLKRSAQSKGQAALKSVKGIPHTVQGRYSAKGMNAITKMRRKRDALVDKANKFEPGSKEFQKYQDKFTKLTNKINSADYQSIGKRKFARDVAVGVTGTGVVTGGAYNAFHDHGAKSASEMVVDIMEKRASANYEYDEYIAKSAAELLVEAVMHKQAAYDQMENAQICFDAGQVALSSIDYKLR